MYKNILSMDSYSFEKKGIQKDMGKKLLSKPDVMSISGVRYPYVCKKKILTKSLVTKNLSIN